jgi:hypothetical protein
MVMLSIVQFAANGWRAVLWWRLVIWRILWFYVLGATIAFALMRLIAFVPDKALVYFALGITPFLAELIPKDWRPNIEWRGVPFLTGMLTTFMQLISGVGGLFLDMFFQKSTLDRKTTVGTKAVTQTFSHILRASYFRIVWRFRRRRGRGAADGPTGSRSCWRSPEPPRRRWS